MSATNQVRLGRGQSYFLQEARPPPAQRPRPERLFIVGRSGMLWTGSEELQKGQGGDNVGTAVKCGAREKSPQSLADLLLPLPLLPQLACRPEKQCYCLSEQPTVSFPTLFAAFRMSIFSGRLLDSNSCRPLVFDFLKTVWSEEERLFPALAYELRQHA